MGYRGPHLWEAVRNTTRDGLATVKLGIRAHVQNLITAGLLPGDHHSSKQVHLQHTRENYEAVVQGAQPICR